MNESALLGVSITATVEFSRAGENGRENVCAFLSFELPVEVPGELAGRAVGANHWTAKELLEPYVSDRLLIHQDAASLRVVDTDGNVLADFDREADAVYNRDPVSEDGPFFVADDSDLVTLQITGVVEA